MKLHLEKSAAGNPILVDSDSGNVIAIVSDVAAVERVFAEHDALVTAVALVPELVASLAWSGRDEDGNLSKEDSRLNNRARKALANLAAVRNGGAK